jgi:hypothetical protein
MNILLCEEIRDELFNKKTLVGVISPGGIKIPNVPFVFPKFAIFVTSECEKDSSFSFEIIDAKGVVSIKGDLPKISKDIQLVHIAINFTPLIFKEYGDYTFIVKRNDGLMASNTLKVQQSKETPQKLN